MFLDAPRLNFFRSWRWLVAINLVVITYCRSADCDLKEDGADYAREVKSILADRCYACHGAFKQEGGLRLDSVASILNGGDSGPVVQPHRAEESMLVHRISQKVDRLRMPPEGKSLSDDQILKIKAWIDSGAATPANDEPQSDPRRHWAFQVPKRPESVPTHVPPSVAEVRTSQQDREAQDSEALLNASRLDQAFNVNVPSSEFHDNPIDRWLSVKHQELGLQPLPPANYRTLVRRLYLDLLGLPPTPEQMEAALNDRSPLAYEKLVDQLLNQPEYGERWGRHWMDVWRYSDWYGRRTVPDVMNSYPQIWRWRDWIVRSLNEDKGYDRMISEMLAADELSPNDDQNIVATGFLVRNWYKWNYETWMKDNVEHVGKAFLGLTLNCAHCHDHKYDPITHEDYFRFRAFFEPLELRHDRVNGEPDPGPFQKYVYAQSYGPISSGAIRVFDEKLDAKTYMYLGGDARNRLEGAEPLDPRPPLALIYEPFSVSSVDLPREAYYPGLKESIRREEREKVAAEHARARQDFDQAVTALMQSTDQFEQSVRTFSQSPLDHHQLSLESLAQTEGDQALATIECEIASAALRVAMARGVALECRIAADDAKFGGRGDPETLAKRAHHAEKLLAYEQAQLAEREAQKGLLVASQKRSSAAPSELEKAKLEELNAQQTLQTARTATSLAQAALREEGTNYTPLSPIYPSTSTGRRSALARWITDQRNPLTARVAVNHIWLRHFGQALVGSTDNFGVQGQRPIHPDILDWLAVELMENRWSMKHLHRIILTSQAYRRASNPPPEHPNFDLDRDNQFYWRFVPRRMEAETVRDSALACSGSIDRKMGGPEIDQQLWFRSKRRSMYFSIHGESKMQFLETFDGPNVCECYRRTSSVMPQQALAMTNSELFVDCGRKLAAAIQRDLAAAETAQDSLDQRFIERAFETILNRPPTDLDLAVSLDFLEEQLRILFEVSSESQNHPINADVVPASKDPAQRARENLAISLFSHNDFVTIR